MSESLEPGSGNQSMFSVSMPAPPAAADPPPPADPGGGTVDCPLCGWKVPLGNGGEANLQMHMNKSKCLKQQKEQAKAKKGQQNGSLFSYFKKAAPIVPPVVSAPRTVHPSTSSFNPNPEPPQSDPRPLDESEINALRMMTLDSVSPLPSRDASPVSTSFDSEHANAARREASLPALLDPIATAVTVTESPKNEGIGKCPGLRLTFPAGQSHHTAYPFGLHAHFSLPWDYYSKGDHFFLRASSCTERMRSDSDLCRKCRQLKSNDLLVGIMDRIVNGVNENTGLIYYPIGGLVSKIRRKNDQIQVMRLTKHNDTQTLARQTAALDRHKEFVMAVGSGKVTRIAPLVRASLNNHEGITALVHRFYRAAGDAYHQGPAYQPKGFTKDERMLALCVLRVGGARLADILHRALGLPGLTTVRKHTVIRPLRASPRMPTVGEIVENIDAYTVGEDIPSGPPQVVHRVVMLDEVGVEDRPRWDDHTNMIIGACREHTTIPVELNDMADAERFFRELARGNVHLAKEATVVALGALSKDPHMYNPQPICISGTCKTEKGAE